MNILELSEQEIIRRNSLNELRAMGIRSDGGGTADPRQRPVDTHENLAKRLYHLRRDGRRASAAEY